MKTLTPPQQETGNGRDKKPRRDAGARSEKHDSRRPLPPHPHLSSSRDRVGEKVPRAGEEDEEEREAAQEAQFRAVPPSI